MGDIPGEGKAIFVLFNDIPEISVAMEKAVSRVVRKAAFDIQAEAATLAPILTGFLKNSIYVVTHGESTYSAINGNGPLLPEVAQPVSGEEAYVAVGAEYGLYVEYGTSKMAAQPYLTPAFEVVRPAFVEALSRLEDRLREEGIILVDTSEIGEE